VITAALRETAPGGSGDGIPRLEVAEWASRYGLVAGITTARDGFSLALSGNEPVGTAVDRWRAFQDYFRARFSTLVFSRQVHGTKVRWYDAPPAGWLMAEGWDGHSTRTPGVLLAVSVADCVPIYLADPKTGAFALLHSGWRGTAGRVLAEGAKVLTAAASSSVSQLVMHCGISICGMCYEVGSEVANSLGMGVPDGTKVRVDLRSLLAEQAWALGIREISVSPLCSAHDADLHSHRASGGKPGRMLAYLGRPKT
jgi:YfiH family protein